MLRKFAVALLAAGVFTAPVFAQGTPPANPPAKTGTVAPATPKVVTAKPTLKVAKVKHGKRFSGRHVANVRHMKRVKSAHGVHNVRHFARSKPTTDARGGAMNSAKPGTN